MGAVIPTTLYLVYRDDAGWSWRFPNGQVPGELKFGGDYWQQSICTPGNFYHYEDGPKLDPEFTVTIEEME